MSDETNYQTKLEADLRQMESELATIAIKDPTTGDWVAVPAEGSQEAADPDLDADGVEEWNERRAVLSQLETRYRNIKRALEKIDKGLYGICEISGEPIEPERLEANPAARTNIINRDREKELSI